MEQFGDYPVFNYGRIDIYTTCRYWHVYLARLQIAVFYCLYRGAKAACSVHGSPSGWHNKSVSTDFHELRQDFSPLNHVLQKRNLCPFSV